MKTIEQWHEEENLIQSHYNDLTDQQRCNVNTLEIETRIWYHEMIALSSKDDYQRRMRTAKHTLSPLDDLKTPMVRILTAINGIEALGNDLVKGLDLQGCFVDAKKAYDSLDSYIHGGIKQLEKSNPIYCAQHGIGKYK